MGVPSSLKLNHKNSNDDRKESFCQNRMNLNRARSKNGPTVFDKISRKKNSSGILSNSGRDHFPPTYSSVPARLPDNFKNCAVAFFLGKKFVSKKFELTGLVEHGLGILGKCVLVHQNVTGLIVKKWLENNWTWKNVLTTCFEQRPNHFWESCWNRKNSWSYDQKINQVSQLQNWLDFMINYLTSLGCSKGTSFLLLNMGAPLLKILHYEFTNRALTQRTCR